MWSSDVNIMSSARCTTSAQRLCRPSWASSLVAIDRMNGNSNRRRSQPKATLPRPRIRSAKPAQTTRARYGNESRLTIARQISATGMCIVPSRISATRADLLNRPVSLATDCPRALASGNTHRRMPRVLARSSSARRVIHRYPGGPTKGEQAPSDATASSLSVPISLDTPGEAGEAGGHDRRRRGPRRGDERKGRLRPTGLRPKPVHLPSTPRPRRVGQRSSSLGGRGETAPLRT